MQPDKELKRLRDRCGLTQEEAAEKTGFNLGTWRSWEQGRHKPSSEKMDRVRRMLDDANFQGRESNGADNRHVERVRVRPVGAGVGKSTAGEEEVVLDTRLLNGSGIGASEYEFVRVVGSSMEPVLTHNQIVLMEPTSRVTGDDLYVYWSDMDDGHVVALISPTKEGLKIEKRGVSPGVNAYTHQTDHSYEDESGRVVEIRIVGRVIGSIGRPAQAIAQANEAARHAANGALQSKE